MFLNQLSADNFVGQHRVASKFNAQSLSLVDKGGVV